MKEKTVIYYYSGSGNTLSAARQIADKLGNTDLKSIYCLKETAQVPKEYTRVGIATATWFIRPPRIVKEICERLVLQKNQKVFIVATCGGYDGFVLIDLKKILQPKVRFPIQTFMLPMPPNHIVGFSPMPDRIVQIYLNHEKKATARIARAIQENKKTKDRKGRGRRAWNWASKTYNLHLGVDRDSTEGGFYTTDACTGCGICEKICHAGNIHLTEDGVEWGHDCQQCMACIMWCPQKAIWHPNIPEGRRRYHHPDITIKDMISLESQSGDREGKAKKEEKQAGGWTLKDIPDLTGKIMIVTGANSGLGFETTRELARKGAKVIMACRNEKKAEAAKRRILKAAPRADLEIMKLDVSSLRSVSDFAERFKASYDRLDVLINNAGIMAAPYAKSEDGFENHFATNYLGHFALTGRLFDLIEATPGGRVVSVSSIAYFLGNKIDFRTIARIDKKRYERWHAYGRSKMECLLFAYEMDWRLKAAGKSTISVAAHPGLARSNIMPAQAKNEVTKRLLTGASYIFKPTIYGAMPIIRAAVEENVKGGEYFGPSKNRLPDVVSSNKASHNRKTAKRLWEISEKLSGVTFLQ